MQKHKPGLLLKTISAQQHLPLHIFIQRNQEQMFRLLSASKQQGKIMDSFDSTEKVNTTVHGMTMTKSVDVSIYYTKWAQLQNALSFIPHGAPLNS